jgi:hypothetical protein
MSMLDPRTLLRPFVSILVDHSSATKNEGEWDT